MSGSRRLAAIMFTDMVGSTALAQTDEAEALKLRDEQESLLRPLFATHQGREIKSMGDGFLAEFDSALRAVQCAIDIQQRLRERNAQTGLTPILLRIGIHLGDVEVRGTDIFGDSVNVASRVEPLAEPGGICVTEPVFGQIRNKIPNTLTKLPTPKLKNVRFPVDVYKIDLPWETPATGDRRSAPEAARRLAVLPLANLSPDAQDAFFAEGLTEEIGSVLSKLPSVRVIARTSVMRYRGTTKGVSEIGSELRVGTILEGSVRRAGNRVRVTAQLVDAASEEQIWSDSYDRELVDIFAIQSEIAKEVAVALGVALPPSSGTSHRPDPSLTAFKAYLKGRSLWNRRSTEHVKAALRCFEEALASDPEYAEAHSGIADCYSILVDRGALQASEGAPKAMAAARRALQIDETIAEAHASLGLSLIREFRWSEAEREYQRALELNPGYASAHQWYYMDLVCRGREDEAAKELALAEDADPFSPVIRFHRGYRAWISGQDDAAIASLNQSAEMGGDPNMTNLFKLLVYSRQSKRAEAEALLPLLRTDGQGWMGSGAPLIARALLGRREEAFRGVETLVAGLRERYVQAGEIAWVYGVLGDADRFFEWIFRSVDERSKSPFDFVTCPLFETLRADSRFREYLRRCALA